MRANPPTVKQNSVGGFRLQVCVNDLKIRTGEGQRLVARF